MTIQRASVVAAAALFALAAGGGDASAQEPTFALTCVGTETGGEIHFETRWGADDDWEPDSVLPGDWMSLMWEYDAPGQNTSPQLQIRFDADMTDAERYVTADLVSFAATDQDCEGQGMTYDFSLDGDSLVLVGAGGAVPLASEPAVGPASDQPGGFSVTFAAPANEKHALVRQVLEASGTIEADVELLNQMLVMPVTVPITFLDSEVQSFYRRDTQEIVISYGELLEEWELYHASRPDATVEELNQFLVDDAEFALFHEVGHALVQLLELPVLGREEDAVDSLAAVIVLDIFEDPDAALAGAEMWRLRAARSGPIDAARLAGMHSLDAQRYEMLKCLVYGSDPEKLADIAAEGGFDERRRWICPQSYQKALDSWQTVLEPHSR